MNVISTQADPTSIAIVGDVSLTYADLAGDPFGLRSDLTAGASVTLVSNSALHVAAALVALDGWANEVHLLADPAAAPDNVVLDTLPPEPAPALGGVRSTTPEPEVPTGWVLYTSGTTGEPKPIRHTLATLARTVSSGEHAAALRWGLLYDPTRMAGLQVVLQSLGSGATLVAPPPDQPLAERVAALVVGGVTALSATPTLWRRILQLPSVGLQLKQVTLGGEIADQKILDALRHRFPTARISHIFASTETGVGFSVGDGMAGFPLDFLDDPQRPIELRVQDGRLQVKTPHVDLADEAGFVDTGDVVEVIDGRVFFRGRDSGVVNVGGANVWPEEVETALRLHQAVQDVVVSGKPNPLSGNVLVATVQLHDAEPPTGLKKELRAWVRARLPSSHVPATVSFVSDLEVGQSGKAQRT